MAVQEELFENMAYPSYEYLDHTAEIGVIGRGADLKEAFCNVAMGMFNLIVDLDKLEEREVRDVEARADDRENLLVAWLNELLYLFDVDYLLFRRFEITEMSDRRLRSLAYGEKADPARHEIKLGIKAATYHLLRVEEGDPCRIQVILDI